jgi:hypothetical protein
VTVVGIANRSMAEHLSGKNSEAIIHVKDYLSLVWLRAWWKRIGGIVKGTATLKKPPAKSSEFSMTSVPVFWPIAMAATLIEEGVELYANNLKFIDEEIKIHGGLRPTLATPNQVRLDLRTMLLRGYSSRAAFRPSSTRPMLVIPP